jgi:hypothetical protein
MRKILFLILLLLSILYTKAKISSNEIGTWKAYMSYHDVTDVVRANKTLYVLASNSLYSYNENDKSITTYDKARGLSDCEINKIAWNNVVKRLIIIYKNGNIDLLDSNDDILNINDILNYTTTDNKNINDIFIYGKYAYLSTGFGVIKINMADAEISDTYRLGFNVDWIDISNNDIHVYSRDKGHFKASMSINLLDKNNWNRVGDYVAQTKENKDELFEIVKTLNPGGPKYNYFYQIKFYNNNLYSVGGTYDADNDVGRAGCVQVLDENNDWGIYQDNFEETTGVHYWDNLDIAVDPTNNNHVFAAGKSGLYEFINGKFIKLHTIENSPIGSALDDNNKNYVLVEGINFDSEGNLWCLNSQSKTGALFQYNKNGEWKKFDIPQLMNGERSIGGLRGPYYDKDNNLWIHNNHWGYKAIFCYQPNNNKITAIDKFYNEDGINIEPRLVKCLTEDKHGNIWIGTDKGPAMIDVSEKTSETPVFNQIKVPRNDGTNLADYLLSGIDITCIAVDEGGRKWFGTNGYGVYLISEDNMTQIEHFTESNSKLISDYIYSIDINNATGEVFFGTYKGLCSYMSDVTATVEKMNNDVTYAYPNPVRPEYTGPITITGLTYNADIKIVTVNGTLVNKGRSTGGSYIWDGNDMNGKRVASGIYMVQTATQTGDKGTVCKIAIVN